MGVRRRSGYLAATSNFYDGRSGRNGIKLDPGFGNVGRVFGNLDHSKVRGAVPAEQRVKATRICPPRGMDARLDNGEGAAWTASIEPPLDQQRLPGYVGVVNAIVGGITWRQFLPVKPGDGDAVGSCQKQARTHFGGGTFVTDSNGGPEVIRGCRLPAYQRFVHSRYGILPYHVMVGAAGEQRDSGSHGKL
jgi:hypothetical protein